MLQFCFVSLLLLLVPTDAWQIQVDSFTDECFYEFAQKSFKVGLSFQVVNGGFLDIDVSIRGPDDHEIYTGPRETSGKYTFSAYKDGKYQVCFSNKMSTLTPKVVMFHVSVEPPIDRSDDVSNNTLSVSGITLKNMMTDLTEALKAVRYEQDYIMVRTNMHHRTSEHTNVVVVRGASYLLFLLFFGGLFQVWYYKRLFEIRRTV